MTRVLGVLRWFHDDRRATRLASFSQKIKEEFVVKAGWCDEINGKPQAYSVILSTTNPDQGKLEPVCQFRRVMD